MDYVSLYKFLVTFGRLPNNGSSLTGLGRTVVHRSEKEVI